MHTSPAAAARFAEQVVADLGRDDVKAFPVSFETTIELRQLLQSESSSIDEVARLLQRDPLLAARTLQAANSSAFARGGKPVTELRAAVVRLGLNRVRGLALSIAMRQMLAYKEMARFARIADELVRHSREVGATAYVVARTHTRLSPDLGLFAGLVHELGTFYLLYRLSAHPELQLDGGDLRDLIDDWRDAIGKAVLGALDVPEEVREAVALHDAPRQVDAIRDLDDLLHVANLLAVRRSGASDPIGLLAGEDSAGETTIRDFELYLATLDAAQEEFAELGAIF